MNVFIWLWNIFWLLYAIGWWLDVPRRALRGGPSIWLVALVWVAVPYAYRYWRDRRDAVDMHADMRGKQPNPADE